MQQRGMLQLHLSVRLLAVLQLHFNMQQRRMGLRMLLPIGLLLQQVLLPVPLLRQHVSQVAQRTLLS